MDFEPPEEIANLSFAEFMSWAMTLWGGHDRVESRSETPTKPVFNYGEMPNRVDAGWLASMGMQGKRTVNEVDSSIPDHKSAATGITRAYTNKAWGKPFAAFCAAGQVPRAVEVWAKGKRHQFDFTTFSAEKVERAIAAWPAITAEFPPEPRDLSTSTKAILTPPRPTSVQADNPRIVLKRNGQAVAARVTKDIVRLRHGTRSDRGVLVSSDGLVLAHRDGDRLRVARVNRVSGATAAWDAPVDLTALPDGEVLAVGLAGRDDLLFVWSCDEGTTLWTSARSGGRPAQLTVLADGRATSAVLHGSRALLAIETDAGFSECNAFPDVRVSLLLCATSAGRTLTLARGSDANQNHGCWLETDGRAVIRFDDAGANLELELLGFTQPWVVDVSGHPLEQAELYVCAGNRPWEHWES